MIKGVIFDVDGTLYDYLANDKIAVKALCRYAKENLNVEEEDFRKFYGEARVIVRERLTDGGARHSRVLFCQTVMELLGENPFCHILKMYDIYWNTFLTNMKPFDGVVDFIRKLKSTGKKISICTDMTAHIQYRKIERLGLKNFIDCMVTSEETGLEKPSPVMFNLALRKLNTSAEETAYFGDSLERDIEGAAKVGIKPFWYIAQKNDDEIKTDFEKIRSYREVINSEIFFGN
ncbi:MAG: HAD-IA family hydrolase [Selenomonadaceae bacterium]|nr:HAD-IA family hydrolase [Selenomonadaceae bacterium]